MNILFIIGWPLNIGGHLNSTMAILNGLEAKGHKTYLIAGQGISSGNFFKPGRKVFLIEPQKNHFKTRSLIFIKALKVIKQFKVDLINAQDYPSLFPAYLATALTQKTFFFTKAGGEVPNYIIPKNIPVIVFSKELQDGMMKKGYQNKIFFIPARIDCSIYHKKAVDPEFIEKYRLPLHGLKVTMAMRFETQKEKFLEGFFNAVQNCFDEDIYFILAGDGALRDWIIREAEKINASFSRNILHLTGHITTPADMCILYNYADIVIGHGRGILEAMACGKPVINIGEDMLGTIIDSITLNYSAHYNFSGRHLRNYPHLGRSIHEEIFRLKKDTALLNTLGTFSLEYIKQNYDSTIGAEALINLYAEAIEQRNRISFGDTLNFFYKRFSFVIRNRISMICHG